jgi:hypothetical protein
MLLLLLMLSNEDGRVRRPETGARGGERAMIASGCDEVCLLHTAQWEVDRRCQWPRCRHRTAAAGREIETAPPLLHLHG